MTYFKILLVALFIVATISAFPSIEPENLRCENTINPLGINEGNPLLSWTLKSDQRNQIQSAYEIIVDDNAKNAEQNKGAVWSSGKITSSENINVTYTGKPLEPRKRYFWRVRVYDDNDQPSQWSSVAWFETAMLKDTDWQATWISDGSAPPARDEDAYKSDPMPLFRKELKPHAFIYRGSDIMKLISMEKKLGITYWIQDGPLTKSKYCMLFTTSRRKSDKVTMWSALCLAMVGGIHCHLNCLVDGISGTTNRQAGHA